MGFNMLWFGAIYLLLQIINLKFEVYFEIRISYTRKRSL